MNSNRLFILLTLSFIGLIAWQIRVVLVILFGSIVLAVAIDVLIQRLQNQLTIPRKFALIIILILLILTGSSIFLILVPELITQIKELGNILPIVFIKIKSILANEPRLVDLQASIPEKFSWDDIQPITSKIIGFAGGAANIFIQLTLISLLAVLLALDPKSHRNIIITITPKSIREQINNLLDKCRLALGGWLTGMTLSATSIFILTWTGLALLKAPLPLLNALICGILTFIPVIGPTSASILPVGISLLISPTLMLEVLILRLFLQNLEAFVLTPFLLKRTVNLLPTVALTTQLILGALLGLPGVILALPLVVVLQVIIQDVVVEKLIEN